MSDTEEGQFQDPFLNCSALKIAEMEEETGFACGSETPEPESAPDTEDWGSTNPSVKSSGTILESIVFDDADNQDNIGAYYNALEETEEGSFGEIPDDLVAENQFILEQVEEQVKLKKVTNLEIVDLFDHKDHWQS